MWPSQPAIKAIEIEQATKPARAPDRVAGISPQYRRPREIRQRAQGNTMRPGAPSAPAGV
jgi:hypothetical protein